MPTKTARQRAGTAVTALRNLARNAGLAEEATAHSKAQPVNQVNQVTTVTAAVPRHHVCPCGTSH